MVTWTGKHIKALLSQGLHGKSIEVKIEEVRKRSKALHNHSMTCLQYTVVQTQDMTNEINHAVQGINGMATETRDSVSESYRTVQSITGPVLETHLMMKETNGAAHSMDDRVQSGLQELKMFIMQKDDKVQKLEEELKIKNGVILVLEERQRQAACINLIGIYQSTSTY